MIDSDDNDDGCILSDEFVIRIEKTLTAKMNKVQKMAARAIAKPRLERAKPRKIKVVDSTAPAGEWAASVIGETTDVERAKELLKNEGISLGMSNEDIERLCPCGKLFVTKNYKQVKCAVHLCECGNKLGETVFSPSSISYRNGRLPKCRSCSVNNDSIRAALNNLIQSKQKQRELTHCGRGHEFTEKNTYILNRGNG